MRRRWQSGSEWAIPLEARVLVKREAPREGTEGGIVLPEQSMKIPMTGTIVGTGVKVGLVTVGDRILFSSYSGSEVTIAGEELLILMEGDILLVLSADADVRDRDGT